MSHRSYSTFSVPPDFSTDPAIGLVDGRETITSGTGKGFASWLSQTDPTFNFSFLTTSAEEWHQVLKHLDQVGGRNSPFYVPTWNEDFRLKEDAAAGDLSILIEGSWFTENVTEDRPDTTGRTLFAVNHLGSYENLKVSSFSEEEDGTRLFLEKELGNDYEKDRSVIGFRFFVRFAKDQFESEHWGVDFSRFDLSFRGVRATRRVDQEEAIEGQSFGNLKPFSVFLGTDNDPRYQETRNAESLGPELYGNPQGDNFTKTWNLKTEDLIVQIKNDEQEIESVLFNGTTTPEHVSFCFNSSGKEIIAWSKTSEVFTLGRFDGSGDPVRLEITGATPVLFNTYGIDSTTDAGTSAIGLFYLKSYEDAVFLRLASENFLIEHVAFRSPAAPLALYRASRVGAFLEIEGMDTGHRRARWVSNAYITPLPVSKGKSRIGSFSGIYKSVRALAPIDSTGGESKIGLLTGDYYEFRPEVETDAGTSAGFSTISHDISGNYESVRILAFIDSTRGGSEIEEALTGEYKLVRALTEEPEAKGGSKIEEITGTYEQE